MQSTLESLIDLAILVADGVFILVGHPSDGVEQLAIIAAILVLMHRYHIAAQGVLGTLVEQFSSAVTGLMSAAGASSAHAAEASTAVTSVAARPPAVDTTATVTSSSGA